MFDHFSQTKAEELFLKLDSDIKPNGIWFYVDFSQQQKGWQKEMTKLMLYFFRLIIGLDISQLPKMKPIFEQNYKQLKLSYFFRNYIESIVYKKT